MKSRFARWLEWLSIIAIVAMFGTVVLQVVARYFLAVAPAWTEEVGRYLMVWLTAIGAGIFFGRKDGYRGAIEFIVGALPGRSRPALNLAMMSVILVFLVLLAIKTFDLVLRNSGVRTPALDLPMSYIYLGVFVMALLMIGGLLNHVLREVREFMDAPRDPPGRPRPRDDGRKSDKA